MGSHAKLFITVAATLAMAVGCQHEAGDADGTSEGSLMTALFDDGGSSSGDDGGGPLPGADAASSSDSGSDGSPSGDGAAPSDPDGGAGDAAPDAFPYDDCHPDVHAVKRNFYTGEITNLVTGRTEIVPPNAMERELTSTPEIVAACDLTNNMLSEASPQHVFWYVGCNTDDAVVNPILLRLAAKYEPEPILANYKCQRFLREDPIPCGVCDSAY